MQYEPTKGAFSSIFLPKKSVSFSSKSGFFLRRIVHSFFEILRRNGCYSFNPSQNFLNLSQSFAQDLPNPCKKNLKKTCNMPQKQPSRSVFFSIILPKNGDSFFKITRYSSRFFSLASPNISAIPPHNLQDYFESLRK